MKISPDNVLAYRMLARLHVKAQAWEAAKRSCDMVLFGYPKDEEMLALKTEIAQHMGGQTPPPAPAPSSPASLFGAAAEPPAARAASDRPAAGGTVAKLQNLLARIQARRSS